ncbi:MAG: LLM class flavin-dependent oxidoreductase, partial [Pseudomonadota bacterium]
MKFGTFLMQTNPSSLSAVARKAEELGYESLWIPEHIILPLEYKSPYPYSTSGRMPAPPETPLHDPMLALAFIAGITTRIRLATGIYVLPIRNPFATAKAVASLDVLSGG